MIMFVLNNYTDLGEWGHYLRGYKESNGIVVVESYNCILSK